MSKSLLYAVAAILLVLIIVGMTGCASLLPNQAVQYYNQGIDLQDEGKYEEAIAQYDKAIESDHGLIDAYIARGYAYLKTGQYETAITDYSAAIELDSENAIAYNGRGAAYLYTKRYHSAGLDFSRAFGIDPSFTQAEKNLGEVNLRLNQSDMNNTLGVNLAKIGNFEEAYVSFTKAIETYPYNYPACTNLGTIFTVTEQYESAMTILEIAILINHNYAPAYSSRGLAYIYTGDFQDAVNDLEIALEIEEPDDATDWNNKGIALEQLGDLDEAAAAYTSALELEPDNEGIKSNVASIATVIKTGGKPGAISSRYLPPRRYWVGPKAEERTTETEFAPFTEPPPVPGWGTTGGVIIGSESLVGKWIDDSPRYGYIQKQQANVWNYNAVLEIDNEVSRQELMQAEQPSTFTGTLRITLAGMSGPITSEPDLASYYHIGDILEFPVSGKHLNSSVELYVGQFTYYLQYDGHDFMGGTTEIDGGDGFSWSISLWLRRVR